MESRALPPARGTRRFRSGFFELCAEADFEPGGKTTLICQTGQVNGDRVQLSTTLVELGEDE